MGSARRVWTPSTWHLHVLGGLLALSYVLIFVRPFYLFSVDVATLPSQIDGEVFGLALRSAGTLSAVGTLLAVGALFAGYGVALWVVRRLAPTPARLGAVFGWAAVAGLLMLFMQPIMTSDIYDYVYRGMQMVKYDASPMVTAPNATPDSPWLRFVFAQHLVSPYGPIWVAGETAAYRLAGGDLVLSMAVIKALGLAAYLLASVVIWRILAVIAPTQTLAGTLLFAWNPLVIVEWVGNGHNDGFMVVLALLAGLAVVRNAWQFVLPALAGAMLVKASAVLLAPLVLVLAVRRFRDGTLPVRPFLVGGAAALLLAIGLYAWVWRGPDTLLHVVRVMSGLTVVNSIGYVLSRVLIRLALLTESQVLPFIRLLGTVTIFIGLTLAALQVWRRPARLMVAWFDATMLALLATAWFWPWYVTWLLAPAALLTDRRRHMTAIIFSAIAPLVYFTTDWQMPGAAFFSDAVVSLVVIMPPTALFIRALWLERCEAPTGTDAAVSPTVPASYPLATPAPPSSMVGEP